MDAYGTIDELNSLIGYIVIQLEEGDSTLRAEKSIVSIGFEETVNQYVVVYMNRLSDCFFAVARAVNHHYNVKEILYERGGKVFHPELKKEDLS